MWLRTCITILPRLHRRTCPSTWFAAEPSKPLVPLSPCPQYASLPLHWAQVVCDPAKIVLTKAPGGCTHKYATASSWKGKECKIAGTVGFTQEVSYGGNAYEIPLTTLSLGQD